MKQQSQKKTRRKNSQKQKKIRFRLFAVLSVLNVLLLVLIIVLFPAAFGNDAETEEKKKNMLGITRITVEGNTRYDTEALLGVSGLAEGQSVFSVSKGQVSKRLRKAFSYVEAADVSVNLRREVTLRITEVPELGAVYTEGGAWMVVDHTGKGIISMPLCSERPLRKVYLKGAEVVFDKAGNPMLSERSLSIAKQLSVALEQYKIDGVGVIDMSNPNDIRLNWKNQITIAMGNDSNLSYEVAVVASALPKVLARHGETATGLLNVSLYSDSTVEAPTVIFTPSSLLKQEEEDKQQEEANMSTTASTGAGSSTKPSQTTKTSHNR